jgi:uncharacterized protein involved in exopolysaccharide biosynthesis
VKRRAFALVLSLGPAALALTARAQTTATQLQIDLVIAYVGLTAMRTRYGEAHADVIAARARVESLGASLRAALLRGDTTDALVVTRALDAELADVRARLAEFSQRCGSGHPDMQTAHARATALEDAIAHVTSEGVFFPPG